jgi:hypothetical protein
MTEETRHNQTVRFNVGGTLFEASRSLFNRGTRESAVLSQLITDHVQDNNHDDAIFIDRDGEIFRHILQFLRYGRVSLPLMISKTAFLRDLEFYGIHVPVEDVDGSIVEDCIDESNANLQAAHRIISLNRECKYKANELKEEREYILVAHECFKEYIRTGSLTVTIKDPDIVPLATNVCHKHDMECFNKYLAKYGLRHVEATNTYSHRTGEYSYITFALEIAIGSSTAAHTSTAAYEEETAE